MAVAETPSDGAAPEGDDKGGKAEPIAAPPTDLQSVHDQIQRERGEELSQPEPEEEEDPEGDDKGGDKADPEGSDEEEEELPTPPEPKPTDPKPEEEQEEPKPPETDDDISKPGKYKSEFVDEEGNKYYVTDISQLPDEFEPRSQKAYGMAMQDLFRKQNTLAADESQYKTTKAEKDRTDAIANLKKSWDTDIEELTTAKSLPEDKKEREKVVGAVYDIMKTEMAKGNVIDSWKTAYKLYRADQLEKQEAARIKAAQDDKKKKGSKVMGSGTGGSPSKPLIRDGVPPGLSLDAVHERALRSL